MASILVVEEFNVWCLKYGNTHKVCEYTCADKCKLLRKSAVRVCFHTSFLISLLILLPVILHSFKITFGHMYIFLFSSIKKFYLYADIYIYIYIYKEEFLNILLRSCELTSFLLHFVLIQHTQVTSTKNKNPSQLS